MLQDAKANQDAVVTAIDPQAIQADLTKLQDKLKVPVEQIYIPSLDDIHCTIGSQWKQRYLVKKDGDLLITPTQMLFHLGLVLAFMLLSVTGLAWM